MTQEGIYSKGKKLLEKQAHPTLEKIAQEGIYSKGKKLVEKSREQPSPVKKKSAPLLNPSQLVVKQMEIREQERKLRLKREAQKEIVAFIVSHLKKELPGVDEELRSQVASVLAAVETLKNPNWELERVVLEKLNVILDKSNM